MHELRESTSRLIIAKAPIRKKASKLVGHLSEKKRKDTTFLSRQKNGATIDFIRLLTVWSPVITREYSVSEAVIRHNIMQTLDLTHDYSKLRDIAFSHSPKGTKSTKDWLIFYKNKEACNLGRTLTPPRYGKGEEFSTPLEIINYQSTLRSLAKAKDMKTYAVTFNLTKDMINQAERSKDTIKSVIEKLNYRLKNAFDKKVPNYYMTAEYVTVRETNNGFTKGEKRLHLHGAILINSEDEEKIKACFKQVNPEARSITLIEQPDILNYYPIRWGSYISKSLGETAGLMSHSLYATGTLKKEAKHHYNELRALIIECQNGEAHELLKPTDRLRELENKWEK
ncbi:MAG: hypothetical protein COA54_15045 [Thiotrichaceae bacterium]|nr:MAG: hypothetical protein COA54_15045 [Thiotrichaceae bacterium]